MILIQEILISEEIVTEHFACHLSRCKGACCVEGDYGAPIEQSELSIMKGILEKVKPYLTQDSIDKITKDGFYTLNSETNRHETALMPDGACVFMGRDEIGITYCGIEKAYNDNKTEWKKPISCHLYPIRAVHNVSTGFKSLNYDRWNICSSACSNGDKHQIKIYEFVKDALIRKYGEEFYIELSAAAEHYNKSK